MIRNFLERLVAGRGEPERSPETTVHEIRGFRVVVENSRPDIATADVLERLDEALALLERYAPARLRHLWA